MVSSDKLDLDMLGSVFNHLVLPPEIPGAEDSDVDGVSNNILLRMIHATNTAMDLTHDVPWREEYQSLRDSLQTCLELNRGHLERDSLLKQFKELDYRQVLILYLNEQNAGLLIRRHKKEDEDRVVFESFEASASSREVLAASTAMQWDFPGRSAHISVDDFAEESFQESLVTFLEQASMESIYSLQASTRKAGVSIGEIRDTTNPALITKMLMSLLEAMGSHYQAPVLRKNIRDDVNLTNSNIPWRRLPFWLILRVAAQRHLCFALGAERGQAGYKFLMAILLAELLEESAGSLSPHKVVCLRTKLARRMAKLEMSQERIKLTKDVTCNSWVTAASTLVRNSMEAANAKVEAAWDSFKRNTTRRIQYLPYHAPPDSLKLTLPNSGHFLDNILPNKLSQPSALAPVTLPTPLDRSIQQSQEFTDCAFELAELEQRIEQDASRQASTPQTPEDRCLELERQIDDVFEAVGSTYNSNPEQNSAMALAVFTLWVELDKNAIAACPLLADHAPVFQPELLDALQLPTKLAMERLQKIQEHLAERHERSIHGSILKTHSRDSIALRYMAKSSSLRSLERRIKADCDAARERKKKEHVNSCKTYDEHTEGIAASLCRCTWEGNQRVVRGCTRCWHWRARQRMKIGIREAFLPEKNPARGTVVFELGIPNWMSAYRDATWHMLSKLAHPYQSKSARPEIHLQDCKPLQCFMEAKVNRLSLASKIKCFEKTHYNFSQGRAPLERVLLPFAADFRLYDSRLQLWVEEFDKPLTLEHLCGIQIPCCLLPILPKKVHPPTTVDGPSSYEIQANQAVVPNDVPVQAFSAYQKLLAGRRRRWPNILVEMSSSNLNLSDEDTTHLICQLASQAGPRLPAEPLRVVHEIFKYPIFATRLTRILEDMLESIRTNWREYNIMQVVIALALRLVRLSTDSLGKTILETARKYLLKWIYELRDNFHSANDSAAAQRYATYGLYAALLCRGTFAIHIGSESHLSQEDLVVWIQASMAVQENTLHDITKLPDTLRGLLLRDAKMVYHIQNNIKGAMKANRIIVAAEISHSRSKKFHDAQEACSSWSFLPQPFDRWIVATTSGYFSERLHFNYIEGHLLLNGKPRSKLPLDIANDDAVKLIFGNQHLLTFTSRWPGMSHRLVRLQEEHEVHFGLRDGHAVIRAVRKGKKSRVAETWEFVPPWRLNSQDSFDLPVELVHNCGHWLNISTRCLEIRRGLPSTPAFWVTRPKDWIIDLPSRRATRGAGGSQLVDPHSATFAQIADIFCDFESPDKLTVFQPTKGKLTVELKHLDLQFVVNQNQLLQCRQLNAEIDPDQDAGTWYGLRSKIVMREIETRSRSIIVPLGELRIRRNDLHVDVRISGGSHYASFRIDGLLGRLSCSPEPRLIYTKALYHAITSFCFPDTLTGRTGASEAFDILQSGVAQPWIPIAGAKNPTFEDFNKLVPRREYYPPSIKRIQKVIWDPNLTSSIQCDAYRPLIEAIKERSNRLQFFTTEPGFQLTETDHLCHRGRFQRQLYDPLLDIEPTLELTQSVYTPRDRQNGDEAYRVYQIARAIVSSCSQFNMNSTLTSILQSYNIIGGFSTLESDAPLLSHAGPLISQIEDPINENWGELVDFCRHATSKASLLFRLGLLAFHNNANMDAIRSLAAFHIVDNIRILNPPRHQYFANFQSRELPPIDVLEGLISLTYPKFQPIRNKKGKELLFDKHSRLETEHANVCRQEGIELAKRIQQHWPMSASDVTTEMLNPVLGESHGHHPSLLINISLAWDEVKTEWQRRYANVELYNYAMRVDEILVPLCHARGTVVPAHLIAAKPAFMAGKYSLSYQSIVRNWTTKRGPDPLNLVETNSLEFIPNFTYDSPTHPHSTRRPLDEIVELNNIIRLFEQSGNDLRKQYAKDLRQSLTAFQMTAQQLEPEIMASGLELTAVDTALRRAQTHMRDAWDAIAAAFIANDSLYQWLKLGVMRPISTPIELLKVLRSTTPLRFGAGMKEAIISYGVALTKVQHLFRIRRALSRRDNQALQDELRHVGHTNWEPIKIPDWLLLEIDSDILIRAEQVAVARAIIDSELGNRILQLSMGKGKTSCIIPMVEAVLADGQNLSRVVVPKALLMQTAQTIQSRLGGLVGRKVAHIPFSRKTSTEQDTLSLYDDLHHEAQECNGIMLTCAEHLLSFKLFGWQKFVDSKTATADQMIEFQGWLDTHSRDVLDECDFTLSVKTQLNYPSGPEMSVDFHPYRWQIAQEVLGLVPCHLRELQRQYPRGIQVTSIRQGAYYPAVQFLKMDVEDALNNFIVDDICSGQLTFLRPAHPQFQQKRSTIREVLSGTRISEEALDHAAHLFANPSIASGALLLVRGLISHRMIVLCLGKRWNVQYGLHPDRHPIAVPYEAKGKPSEQAEYGHPDVAILFTCLSFYYAGLTQEQLVQGVQNILQSNDPAAQYEWWTSSCKELPRSLRHWNVINSDDKGQMAELWRLLRWNRIVINHYLNHFVFPVHARQFEVKLQACSWDIPICSQKGTQLARTTGFSGTNDNRLMLPLTISQRDLPELQHTSAEVLSYLLQKRNRNFHIIANQKGKRLTEREFLEDLKLKRISVLIDVGAYISEMQNGELARAWLEVDSDAKAVVYFRSDNRAWVHYRSDAKGDVPLLATPFAENLSGCNVFLDEGHTRGVDLRLPTHARGAVTLALKLTKDHTVQAAMRLRQLRTTQSIAFYGPPEVDQSIRDFCHLDLLERIDSSHVASWLLEQTCRSVEDLQGLYVAQGIDFCRRTDAIWQRGDFKTKHNERQKLLRVLKQPERKTLKELYGPASQTSSIILENDLVSLQLRSFMDKLVQVSKDQRGRIQAGALEEVEQERQVEAQVEQVRQVEKRKRYTALAFPGMHPEIVVFARTGRLEALKSTHPGKPGFEHAFAFVGKTTIGKHFGVRETNSKLFVSSEFAKTVEVARDSREDNNFLRSVEWIVWAPHTETALVVIPEEAEYLIGFLRGREGKLRIHMISYAAPVTKAMLQFNSLEFYSFPELPNGQAIPARIKIELGILAGRLYVDESEWEAVARYVRGSETGSAKDSDKIAADPAAFLLEWLALRRKTVDVLHTPMGYICTGREMETAGLSEDADEV